MSTRAVAAARLIAAVATQSISVLGTLLAHYFGPYREPLLFFTLCMFLVGCMLYLILITLIFYRFTFFSLTTATLTPPYWINMGAVAITTLAGANILLKGDSAFLADMIPFIKGFTLFFWATGTWWIPLLLILGDWRHVVSRVPLAYHPSYWALVFPLGMYTAATLQLAIALDLSFLRVIPNVFVYVAIAAWLVVFTGMMVSLARSSFKTRATEAAPK